MNWSLVFDLAGTFFFAVSGCLLAARKNFDIIGSLLLGALTGLGGGITRDLILGVPPVAFAQPVNFLPPIAAAILVYFFVAPVERFPRALLVFDAGGLALFCTSGTTAALNAGMNPFSSVLLGAMTGIGGGLLRDVVANREPELFNPADIYAVPALVGAALISAAWATDLLNPLTTFLVAMLVFVFRVASLHFGWHVPKATHTTAGSESR